MGVNSDLGPIDPQFMLGDVGPVPCEFIEKDTSFPEYIRLMARTAVMRMRKLAKKFLSDGMLKSLDESALNDVIEKISSSDTYKSHGSVIDFGEAEQLGLSVEWMPPSEELWRRVWLLYCCYDHDVKLRNYGKIVEGCVNSNSRPPVRH